MNNKLMVNGAEISVTTIDDKDYISLTDMLKAKDGEVNSALVRGLSGKSGKALAAGNSFNLAIPVGAIRVVFAYPATLRDVSSVQDVNGMNAEVKTAFTKTVVSVEGANGYQAIDYKVYVMDMANANDTANTYKVTI